MPTKDFPAETIIQRMFCDSKDCEGEVLPTGNMDMETSPDAIYFEHRCKECGLRYNFDIPRDRCPYGTQICRIRTTWRVDHSSKIRETIPY